ncbi:cysteine hydrolase family protein [Candidatus Bipolaricaulota bacterium]
MTTALMVIDVQPVFLDGNDFRTIDGNDLVAKCAGLIKRAREAGVPLVYVEHADEDDMPQGTAPQAKVTHTDLAPAPGEPVVHKLFGSGFMETNLDDVLKSRGIERLVVCGLSTFGCVQATALYAKLYGYDVAVVGNAHAGNNSDAFPTSKGIPIFEKAWKKGGIRILGPTDDPFRA